MSLRLRIDNVVNLPDGGPLTCEVSGGRGIDIGRFQHLDWTLPDESRTVSGKHCEIRYHDNAYWLRDISTNGTFVNGSPHRMAGEHKLCNGDRLEIGPYIVSVTTTLAVEASVITEDGSSRGRPPIGNIWDAADDAAPPATAREFMAPPPRSASLLDWNVPLENFSFADSGSSEVSRGPVPGGAGRSPVPAPVPVPSPRRAMPPEDTWGHSPDPRVADNQAASAADPLRDGQSGHASPLAVPGADGGDEFVKRFAAAAGLPGEVLKGRDAGELADELGTLMRIVAEEMKVLLAARNDSKRLARSSEQTTIQLLNNNALKFSPNATDALKLMFGSPSSSYLDARSTLRESFRDLKTHQVKTFSAMQEALARLLQDLDPGAIEEREGDGGFATLRQFRKARLWDSFVHRWKLKSEVHADGLLGAFLVLFSECYDREPRGGERRPGDR